MKRLFLLCIAVLLLSGCALRSQDKKGYLVFQEPPESTTTKTNESVSVSESKEIRGCWLSYIELNPEKITKESDYRLYLQQRFEPLKRLGITDIFVQVRPFADAVYPSNLFESSDCVVPHRGDPLPFDFLAVILEEAAKLTFRVHAWINPYRVLLDQTERSRISSNSAVGILIDGKQGRNVIACKTGLWLQPASLDVQKLILDGVREILLRYKVAGIHIDDYFYPPDIGTGDAHFYRAYLNAGGTLPVHAWRCEQINQLLSSLWRTVHDYDNQLVFSVSPGGNPDVDRKSCCADVALWCMESGYCDWIIPQLYYGLQHQTMPFVRAAKQWEAFRKTDSVRLLAGLAMYKTGREDVYAGAKGSGEWMRDSSIIAKQVQLLRRLGYDGFSLFSAQFVNFQEKVYAKACQKLERVL